VAVDAQRTAGRPARGIWGVIGASAGSKVIVLVVSGLLSFVTTHLMITHFGVSAYAQFGLLASMAALLPFADLGMSAAVLNAVSASSAPSEDPHVRATLTSVLRVLLLSAVGLVAIGVVVSLLGGWSPLLGDGLLPDGGSRAALACLVVFALTLPLGVGLRIIIGLGRNHIQVWIQGLAAPTILLGVVALIPVGASAGTYLAVLSYLAAAVVAGASFALAWRWLSPQMRLAVADVPHRRTVPGVAVMNVAWPMLVQMVAVPLALQTDRLLLSHLAPTSQLARYNLAAQLFGLVIQTVNTAGVALWPVFTKARARGEIMSPFKASWAFLGGGTLVAGVLAVLLPWVVPVLTSSRVTLDGAVIGGFVAYVALQAVKYPLGMYMTDVHGLRFQVVPIIVMVPVNLVLSYALIGPLGAGGSVLGSVIAVLVCQVLPNFWYVRRDLARRRTERTRA
jgi:O-antigen/teichoic acid export membrane protein